MRENLLRNHAAQELIDLGRLTAELHNLVITRTYYASYESLLLLLSAS